jgi:putative ABC transport system permease protein
MLRQLQTVLALNFKSLPRRIWQSLIIVIGMAAVVAVLVSMLSFSEGLIAVNAKTGSAGRAVILSKDSQYEFGSSIPRDSIAVIEDAAGIGKDRNGASLADPEILFGIPTTSKSNGFDETVLLRSFGPRALALSPKFKVVSGRMFRPGAQEMMVGVAAANQFSGLKVGDKVTMPNGQWPIVGSFSTGGDIVEGELIADTDTIMPAVRRNAFNSVIVSLQSPTAFSSLKNSLTSNPSLSITAERQSDYYARTASQFLGFFETVAYAVGTLMAVGTLLATVSTMYWAIGARAREIATLRALGFGALPVAITVVVETEILSIVGALIGSAIAWFLYNGQQDNFGSTVFHLSVSPSLICLGIAWALIIALLAGLLPSMMAARLPIAEALRAT